MENGFNKNGRKIKGDYYGNVGKKWNRVGLDCCSGSGKNVIRDIF